MPIKKITIKSKKSSTFSKKNTLSQMTLSKKEQEYNLSLLSSWVIKTTTIALINSLNPLLKFSSSV
jgi:hypothetical protein